MRARSGYLERDRMPRKAEHDVRPRLSLLSLGCDKNLCDSERMLGELISEGFIYEPDEERADVIIINTCCFIGDAKEESVRAVLEAAELKKRGNLKKLIVTGCMAERYKDEILAELPEVDAVIGTNSFQQIGAILKDVRAGERKELFLPLSENHLSEVSGMKRELSGFGGYAYLKIAEGCNKRCSYCIIPYLRGPQRSVPMEELVKEASELSERGIKELILVAQETSVYGVDLYKRKMLPELLRRLSGVEGIEWIRILYCYPEEVTDELIDTMAELPKVCHYLDIPIQHASDHILRRMDRATTRAEITERIGRIRERIPDIALRTTLISGFPGESDADHQILCEFVREMEFDRLGDFTYSREEGTKAAAFSHQISKRLKEKRRDEIMEIQQEIAFKKASLRVGKTYRALIEGRLTDIDELPLEAETSADEGISADESPMEGGNSPKEALSHGDHGNIYIGRTYMDAPDVDGYVYIDAGKRELMSGDMVSVRVTGARGYDLLAELIP